MFKSLVGLFLRIFLECLYFVTPRLSWNAMYRLSDMLARTFYAVWPKHRNITLKNLNLVFGKEKSQQEIKAIALQNYSYMMRSVFDTLRTPYLTRKELESHFLVTGEENLKQALAKGRGAVLFTAHWGGFSMLPHRIDEQGYDVWYLLRAPHDEQFKQFYVKVMMHGGSKYLWDNRETIIKDTIKLLKDKKVVVLAGDQYYATGIEIQFLGQPTLFTDGPIILALRSRAPLLPSFITRGPDNIHTVSIEPEYVFKEGVDLKEKVHTALLDLTKNLEQKIRTDPCQWLWLHRRWKNLKGMY